jgi:DNA repair protein RadA/Sms
VRPVGHAEARLKEAAKLGFGEAWVPKRPAGRRASSSEGLNVLEIGHLSELVTRLSPPRRRLTPAGTGRIAVAP